MTRVLVAVDEAPQSLRAARAAVNLFAGPDTEFLVINVAGLPVRWLGGGMYGEAVTVPMDTWLPDVERIERDQTEGVRAEAAAAGVPDPDILVAFGDPVEKICAAADDHDVDVIVVGSHDKGFLRRLIDPSVADHIVHATSRPVLVVSGEKST